MATVCFERAGDNSWEEKSKAAGDRVKSNSSSSEPKEENVVPREAQDIGMAESSAQCLVDLEDHERAGMNFNFVIYVYSFMSFFNE